MAVIIMHPTEELIFAKLQKELISELFEDGRIMIAVKPLWIPVNSVPLVIECEQSERIEITGSTGNDGVDTGHGGFDTTFRVIQPPAFGEIEFSEDRIFLPVTVQSEKNQLHSKLTLVILHSGRQFTDLDRQRITKIKQPVRQIKVFRLGNEKELSSISKCIIESKWIKIK